MLIHSTYDQTLSLVLCHLRLYLAQEFLKYLFIDEICSSHQIDFLLALNASDIQQCLCDIDNLPAWKKSFLDVYICFIRSDRQISKTYSSNTLSIRDLIKESIEILVFSTLPFHWESMSKLRKNHIAIAKTCFLCKPWSFCANKLNSLSFSRNT